MNKDKKLEEFDEKFSERIHTSFECSDAEKTFVDIKDFLRQALEQQQADLIEKIEKKKLTKDKAYKDKREIECQCGSGEKHTLPLQDWTDVSIYNTALSDIINLIKEG